MDTLQQHINTIDTVQKAAQQWLANESTKLYHNKRYDRTNKVNTTKFMVTSAISFMLCADMECDFDLSSDTLESMIKYIQTKD